MVRGEQGCSSQGHPWPVDQANREEKRRGPWYMDSTEKLPLPVIPGEGERRHSAKGQLSLSELRFFVLKMQTVIFTAKN